MTPADGRAHRVSVGAVGWLAARKTAKQTELFVGAQAAIAWREQVFSLHDRGLSPGQIRFVLHLEDGGAGYGGW